MNPDRAHSVAGRAPGPAALQTKIGTRFEEHTTVAKQLLFSDAARRKLFEGVDILAHAVGTTLGPPGAT